VTVERKARDLSVKICEVGFCLILAPKTVYVFSNFETRIKTPSVLRS